MAHQDVFDTLIWDSGKRHGIDPALIKAIVAAESNFDPNAYRREPHINDASYGLMQTLYRTAQQMGYGGPTTGLFQPETSLEFGTRYLKQQLLRYSGDTERAVAAYNAGSATRTAEGGFINQTYVNRVLRFFRQFRSLQATTSGQHTPSTVWLTPGVKAPSISPPVRVQVNQEGNMQNFSLETFLTPETQPWILGGATLLALSVFMKRKR